jgi:hypothetical protein
MALKLTEQELKDLGFKLTSPTEGSFIKIHARKSVGYNDAFFLYEEKSDMYSWREGVIFRSFEIVTDTDNGFRTVIDNIETLERFHELENCLNKK